MGCMQNQAQSIEISIVILSPPMTISPQSEVHLMPYSNEEFPAARLPTTISDVSTKVNINKLMRSRSDGNQGREFQSMNSCPYF